MRITIINQFYPPDISPTGRLAESLAAHRASLGDDVTVIAGQGYVAQSDGEHPADRSDVCILRIWTPRLGKANIVRRCLDYLVFLTIATWRALRLKRQDVIICLTTPPFIVVAGVMHKFFHRRSRVILWNMDCYPEVAERAGVIRRGGLVSPMFRLVNWGISQWIDGIVCLDDAMRSLLVSRTSDRQNRISPIVIPNWEPLSCFPSQECGEVNKAHEDEFIILYNGNLGHGHCFKTMLAVAQRLDDENARVRFVVTGRGVGYKPIAEQVQRHRRLRNIAFLGYVSAERLRRLQTSAGCALITLRDDMLGVMSPSKLHASLAMGLPIIYVGPPGNNVDKAIQEFGCGVRLSHGDVDGFVDFVHMLSTNQFARAAYSDCARKAFESEYCDKQTLPKFDQIIDSARGSEVDQAVCRVA